MDRRLLKVLGMSVVLALVVSGIFYQMAVRASGRRAEPVEMKDLVVAAQPLPVGAGIKPSQVKVTRIPANLFPKGGFSKVEEVIDRPLVSNILMDEPVLEGRLAARGSGLGLAPIIPAGMRAVSVRVNDVVGVAGFVLPGMRVDVLVTGRPPNYEGTITTTVLQNILVLSAGQTIQPEPQGQAINAPVVTLLVTPEQAETLTLAGSEGRIQLVLRNGVDQKVEQTPGREVADLYGVRGIRKPAPAPKPQPKPRRTESAAAAAPPPPPPPPPPDEVVVIRGNQKTVEVIGAKRGE
ncbi:MAG: Flp pilus assembly protein CpaB [Bryobacterales bacterium]|nr:Flp pilus assembly protein CpaB [Bryobacterales bacterium]